MSSKHSRDQVVDAKAILKGDGGTKTLRKERGHGGTGGYGTGPGGVCHGRAELDLSSPQRNRCILKNHPPAHRAGRGAGFGFHPIGPQGPTSALAGGISARHAASFPEASDADSLIHQYTDVWTGLRVNMFISAIH